MNQPKIYSAHIFELGCMDQEVYLKSDVDKVLSEKDKILAEKEADYREACGRLQTANFIKDEQKVEMDKLLMKIAGLEKLVETANKLIKQKGGFTIKDIEFGGVKLEGINASKNESEKFKETK